MKAVMISIRPKWVEKIASGEKTVEVKKTAPKLEVPFKCYIYCTFPKKPFYTLWLNRGTDNCFLADGKVVGEFVCDDLFDFIQFGMGIAACKIEDGKVFFTDTNLFSKTCLSAKEMEEYLGHDKDGYGWHISDLKIYDKPKELSDFKRHDNTYDNSFGWCFEDKEKSYKLKRPPQSWCYVEAEV